MMPKNDKPPTTQRAYTLRLRGADPQDVSWRDALWRTHEAVNAGSKTFGDWLLTFRGGIDHSLAENKIKDGHTAPVQDDSERKNRRILLALSWLSVESRLGAPADFIIASGEDIAKERNSRVIAAFEKILRDRRLAKKEIDEWTNDCKASLCAAIREDAVWVNRSQSFDAAVKFIGSSLTREEVWDFLEPFFGSREAYLAPLKKDDSEDESSEEDKAKDLVQKAGQWLSSRFGTGKGADFCHMAEVYQKIANLAGKASPNKSGMITIADLASKLSKSFPLASKDLNGVLSLISGPGHKSATRNLLRGIGRKTAFTQSDLDELKQEATDDAQKCKKKTGAKGQRLYANAILNAVESATGFTYRVDEMGNLVSVGDYAHYKADYNWGSANHAEFSVILDHAARRVSLAHTWIKRAEAERRRFEEDTTRINNIPHEAKRLLDDFCFERSSSSGALEPYRIRRRAVDGWKDVVAAWSKKDCSDSEERKKAARKLQDDPEVEKFGDIQLFERLAEDDALCVWHKGSDATKEPDPQALIDYASATQAEFKKQQFKVPAYRHPDALLHPVFCDFGNSRWEISFDIHQNKQASKSKALSMTLWTGSKMEPVSMCWQSKRLAHDLALGQHVQNGEAIDVSRADRLGRAASDVSNNGVVRITGLFEQKDWNGRLQAPRQQLEAIAARKGQLPKDHERRAQIKDHIRWLVTFSAKLQPQGPWCEFAENHQLRINPKYSPHVEENRGREGQAKLILSRFPGLRVLSVDLGHRYAAACAVWEAVSIKQVKDACKAAGEKSPTEKDLYLHLKEKVKKPKNGKKVEVEKTTIYRRLGADKLPDGTPHPAPWARLDRQFLIKLQGEEESREASNDEIWAVHQLEARLGKSLPLIDRLDKSNWNKTNKQKARLATLGDLGWVPTKEISTSTKKSKDGVEIHKPSLSVEELMSSTVRLMGNALKRHGDHARIAFALTADYKPMPGDRKYYFKEAKDASAKDSATERSQKHIEFIQDNLYLWYELTSSGWWRDSDAQKLWDEYIAKLPSYSPPEEIDEEASGPERKKRKNENWNNLHAAAESLVKNLKLRKTLHDTWRKRWEADDDIWKKQLRWFKDWILPRGQETKGPAIRKVGGLSLSRLATLTEFRRKIQVGFFTRLRPDGTRDETKEHFGQSSLNSLEKLREQRVKQLASRIAEAALGIGRIKRPKKGKDPKRPCHRVDLPCHAIVIENLTLYRPEETRTRRENRQLMTWSSSKVKKYLDESCQLYGLHLREVSASYTSRQDSRTGSPGIRCQDVLVKDFMLTPFWRKQVAQAEKKHSEDKGDARVRFLCELNTMWKDKSPADWEKAAPIRVPLKGGELFVSSNPDSPAAKGLQADLNAAANIGLKALIDPDWSGKWWYVPCDPLSFKPALDKVKGSAAIDLDLPLKDPPEAKSGSHGKRSGKTKSKSKDVVNLWRDVSSQSILAEEGPWLVYEAYQNRVQERVVKILQKFTNQQKKNRKKK
jgi:IS605 OrfB family transposase